MSNTAYIKLVPASKKQEISLEELKDLFQEYKNMTAKTGEQLNWDYEHYAFPYEIKERDDADHKWFYLKGVNDEYHYILIGVETEQVEEEDGTFQNQSVIQIALPTSCTHGDKNKANEFAKYIGKKLNGELHLFNGRIMYYYKKR